LRTVAGRRCLRKVRGASSSFFFSALSREDGDRVVLEEKTRRCSTSAKFRQWILRKSRVHLNGCIIEVQISEGRPKVGVDLYNKIRIPSASDLTGKASKENERLTVSEVLCILLLSLVPDVEELGEESDSWVGSDVDGAHERESVVDHELVERHAKTRSTKVLVKGKVAKRESW
jgi:hypothetical protein